VWEYQDDHHSAHRFGCFGAGKLPPMGENRGKANRHFEKSDEKK
jgi:hypothetical protein